MKYKVGDRVLIREWDDMEEEFGLSYDGDIKTKQPFMEEMRKFCGTKQSVSQVRSDYYQLNDCGGWGFTDDMFKRKVAEITKEDLKTGYIVTLRNGREYSVILGANSSVYYNADCLVNTEVGESEPLAFYLSNLKHEFSDKSDIVKVRKGTILRYIGRPCLDKDGDVLWVREEPKEMTVAEIEVLLGYPVKIVKEKADVD